VEGRYSSRSCVFSGQPSEEKGTSADEYQVSSTSSSRRSFLPGALACASASFSATYTLPSSSYQAGIWWPHQSWREMVQSWMFSIQWL
jgi:hypothetical protein